MNFDDIIIGAGPGGYSLAAGLAARGRNVALVERDQLGGTCLNRGCIPTKCLCASADRLLKVSTAARLGIVTDRPTVDFTAVRRHLDQVVATLRQGVATEVSNATVIKGEARLLGGGRVLVNAPADTATGSADTEYTASRIIIATGSAPAILPVAGAERALTSDDLLQLTQLPQSVSIIGGGVIGIEFASILNALGCDVSVIEYCREILPGFDPDMAKRLRSYLSRRGINFVTGATVTAINDGREVVFESRKGDGSVWADMVLMAVGRRAVVPEGCTEAGVQLTDKGFIKVDRQMATTAEGIYAIGDVTGLCMLAHAAEAQAAVILGESVNTDIIPSAVFCEPEAAMVGKGEEACKTAGIDCRSVKGNFAGNGKALAMDETDGAVKITYSPADGRLLGMQIIGPHAADLIAECAALLYVHATIDDLRHGLVHAHPTLSEVLK